MKSQNLFFTFFAAMALFTDLNAQSRENKQTVQFSARSQKIESATGWEQNKETGKWVENQNFIRDKESKNYWAGHVTQSFKWIQFATISYKEQIYYVLLYEQVSGYYRYPNIQEDWYDYNKTCFFIITQLDYENMKKSLSQKNGETIKVSSKISESIKDAFQILGGEHVYNEENLLAKITKSLETPGYYETSFLLNFQLVDGKEVIRFCLPENSYSSANFLKTKYFEVGKTEFEKILTQ